MQTNGKYFQMKIIIMRVIFFFSNNIFKVGVKKVLYLDQVVSGSGDHADNKQ